MRPPAIDDVSTLFTRLSPARERLAANDARILATQIALSEVPAPTGSEMQRGLLVADHFRQVGLSNVHVDDAGNVIGERCGITAEAPVVVCAHLDTVFPTGTDTRVKSDGTVLTGPGIVDNARGLAVMLALSEVVERARRPVVFAATVGEEGSGDLRGAKHLFASFDESPSACIALDGAGDDRIVNRALGARRFRVSIRGEGGHSWASFGTPNPVHAAGAATAKIAAMPLPRTPRTTLSVCRIGGGLSVNSIPDEAWIEIDLRSLSTHTLDQCTTELQLAIRAAVREENARRSTGASALTWTIETIGDRPCGEVHPTHPLVQAALQATRDIGRHPELAMASTDANVPISLGIPAIAIGAGGRGGGVHTSAEWYDNTEGTLGVARALMILVAAADL